MVAVEVLVGEGVLVGVAVAVGAVVPVGAGVSVATSAEGKPSLPLGVLEAVAVADEGVSVACCVAEAGDGFGDAVASLANGWPKAPVVRVDALGVGLAVTSRS